MGKTFKIDPDNREHTTKTKRFGNARKAKAIAAIKERRQKRMKLESLMEKGDLYERD